MLVVLFVVQHCLGAQLAGGLVNFEVGSVIDAIGEPVVVLVGGRDRRSEVATRRQVLADAAVVVAGRRKFGGSVRSRFFADRVGADGDGGVSRVVAVILAGDNPQVAARVFGVNWGVGGRRRTGDGRTGTAPSGGAVPLPRGPSGAVVVLQRGRKRYVLLGLD